MAKTTRKTEPTTAEKKPVTRRVKAAAPAAGAAKATRTRKKPEGPSAIPAMTEIEVANLGQPVQAPAIPTEPTHDEIALRAWSIYESRGGGHDQAFDDWVEARRQLLAERGIAE